ncbi:MAG: EamA family transporter [Desulfobacteraceae bacterium]|nr:EamA family transporter [Desulfobacteraceae bacterium]
MENFMFYTLTVLIWGSTWLAIKFQLGPVDPMISVIYRFSLAAILLMAWCVVKRLRMRFTLKDHAFMVLQGALLFGVNYWLFYVAELYLTSGLAAVIFSTIVVMNMVNANLFLKAPFDPKVIAGGALGLVGIIFVFKPELARFHFGDNGMKGMVLCLIATYSASLGNIISARNQKQGLPIIQTNAYGMAYGTILMLMAALVMGKEFTLVLSTTYVTALVYLAVFGSIVAFGCYLSLVGRIGADRAAYATLLFPIVALVISTIWENYHWSGEAVTGVTLILLGNLLMVNKRPRTTGVSSTLLTKNSRGQA